MAARQFLTAELPACRVDPDLKHAVEQLARDQERSVSAIVRAALREHVKREGGKK
jgi:predicted transcriptional regulator